MILDLARVLRVEPEKLIGRPWDYAPNGEPGVDGLDDVRGYFTRYDDLLDPQPRQPIDLVQLGTVRMRILKSVKIGRRCLVPVQACREPVEHMVEGSA